MWTEWVGVHLQVSISQIILRERERERVEKLRVEQEGS